MRAITILAYLVTSKSLLDLVFLGIPLLFWLLDLWKFCFPQNLEMLRSTFFLY